MLLGAPLGECRLIAKAFRSVRSDNTSIDLDKVSPANATKLGDVRPRDDPRGTTDGGRSKTASRALGREIRLLMPTTEQRRLMARNTHTFPGAQSNGGFLPPTGGLGSMPPTASCDLWDAPVPARGKLAWPITNYVPLPGVCRFG
jgi:hypothetical protein